MKITDNLVAKVHQAVNRRIFKEYPALDMADLSKGFEGHIKKWEVEWVIDAYNQLKRRE